jgi:hypothetical protein
MSKSKLPESVPDNDADQDETHARDEAPAEYGGPKGKEPTRYGDWEKNGRCIDF